MAMTPGLTHRDSPGDSGAYFVWPQESQGRWHHPYAAVPFWQRVAPRHCLPAPACNTQGWFCGPHLDDGDQIQVSEPRECDGAVLGSASVSSGSLRTTELNLRSCTEHHLLRSMY
jgi:hypothetical protein